jgi:hypothetical protein
MKSPLHYIDPILTVQGNAPINNYEFSELLGNSMVLRTANTHPIAAKLIFFLITTRSAYQGQQLKLILIRDNVLQAARNIAS